jgi:hypothetical protein
VHALSDLNRCYRIRGVRIPQRMAVDPLVAVKVSVYLKDQSY